MRPRLFVKGDVDGFFGLFIDNLLQLMVIQQLCTTVCGLPDELVTGRILPGAALSILVGNLFYAWQARRLMIQTGRTDITALPYGINTPSLIAYIFFIIMPVYLSVKEDLGQEAAVDAAWMAGVLACFFSGIMECVGAFCGDWLRRHTPRAALLPALGGIAITFISMGFVFQLFSMPCVSIIPMIILLGVYASRIRLPLGIPGGLVAVCVGVAIAWALIGMGYGEYSFTPPGKEYTFQLHLPKPVIGGLWNLIMSDNCLKYMSVIIPMGLFNVIGSLQNLESAEAAGDRFETKSSLMANGVGTLVAAMFGSAFPTTIYIGHPAWKDMGARIGYSVINGVVIFLLCMCGGVTMVLNFVPMEATLAIVLWIGIIMTAQSFKDVPKPHTLAVAFGFIPALAAWAFFLIETTIRTVGITFATEFSKELGDTVNSIPAMFQKILPMFSTQNFFIHGVIALNQGFMLTAMGFAAILVHIIDRQFLRASLWAGALSLFSLVGIIHAYQTTPFGIKNVFFSTAALDFAIVYALSSGALLAFHYISRNQLHKEILT